MKKVIIGFVVTVALVISACGGTEVDEAKAIASTHKEFEQVSVDTVGDNVDTVVVKHKDTGCYYVITEAYKSGGITQMFVKENGVSVPYCK